MRNRVLAAFMLRCVNDAHCILSSGVLDVIEAIDVAGELVGLVDVKYVSMKWPSRDCLIS